MGNIWAKISLAWPTNLTTYIRGSSNTKLPLLISGALISPVDQRSYRILTNALLYVGEDGLVKAIKQVEPPGAPVSAEHVDTFLESVGHSGALERLDLARGEFLIPGFIDTHTVCVHHVRQCD